MAPSKSGRAASETALDLPDAATPGSVSSQPEPLMVRFAHGSMSRAENVLVWVAFVLGVILLCGQFWRGVNPQDEGEMLTYPWLISQGAVPYEHVWMMYPPATFLLLAGLFKVGIPGLLAERALGIVVRIAFVLLVNRAMTTSWRRASVVGLLVSLSLMFLTADISVAAYAWLVGLPLVLGGLLFVRSARPGWAALVFGIASVFRLEFGLAGIAALVTFTAVTWLNGDRRRADWRPAITLCLAVIAFYALLAAVTSGQALQEILIQPIVHIEPYRRVSLLPPGFGPLGVPAAIITLLGPPMLVLVGFLTRRPWITATNVAICILLAQVIQDPDWGHLFGVAAIAVPWTILTLLDAYRDDLSSRRILAGSRELGTRFASSRLVLALRLCAVVGALYIVFVIAYGIVASPLSPASSVFIGNGPANVIGSGSHMIVARTAKEARDGNEVSAYLRAHDRPGESVYIIPSALFSGEYNMTVLYYALGLPPASMYLESDPGLQIQPGVQATILKELHRCTWVIVWKDVRQAGDRNGRVKSAGERYLGNAFRPVLVNQTYVVLKRRSSLH